MAAPPLSRVELPLPSSVAGAAGAAAGAAPSPFLAPRTSALVMRPLGPLPATELRSMPSAAATRAATGETLASSGTTGALGAAASAVAAPLPDDADGGLAA